MVIEHRSVHIDQSLTDAIFYVRKVRGTELIYNESSTVNGLRADVRRFMTYSSSWRSDIASLYYGGRRSISEKYVYR
jgi:hypothetical protein